MIRAHKVCTKCKVDKDIHEFYPRSEYSEGTVRSECKACHAIRMYSMKQGRLHKIHALKAKPCADCGVQYPYWVMQFDHLRDKQFNMNELKRGSANYNKSVDESKKCEVVCANCHATRTYCRSINMDVANVG
jgi:hypothetical protein